MTTQGQKLPPMTEQEMIQAWRRGETIIQIAGKAKHRNGLSKSEVRIIVFGADK